MEHTRGFVTIATGHERYFELARNCLYSYRQFSCDPYPFAIITDRENEYTREFDKVIVISDPDNSYMDKLKLYRELPFDETIFIDADSLAYGDLNAWWDIFAQAGDFSVFGYAWKDLSSGRGWFVPEGMGSYSQDIAFIPDFNGGVYYMRKTEACKKVFDIAISAAKNYKNYAFRGFIDPADEPVLALGMAVCRFEPLDERELAFAPKRSQICADISVPAALYSRRRGDVYPVRIIHWSNYRTRKSLYRFEVKKLMALRKNPAYINTWHYKILYEWKLLYLYMQIYDLTAFVYRVKTKLKKLRESL